MLALGRGLGVLLAEALNTTRGVDQLLLAREEGVALGADVEMDLVLRRARLERVPAGADDLGGRVHGMDVGLHGSTSVVFRTSLEQ